MITVVPEKPVDIAKLEESLVAIGEQMANPQKIIVEAVNLRITLLETWELIKENKKLKLEIQRLKEGKFTPDEFQNLCHNFDCKDREAFKKGCLEYQEKLFGKE